MFEPFAREIKKQFLQQNVQFWNVSVTFRLQLKIHLKLLEALGLGSELKEYVFLKKYMKII